MKLGRLGLVARFKPLHDGGALMLDYACRNADHVVIGLGSANKYNYRNPFTVHESEEMVDRYLAGKHDNYSIIHVPDFGHILEYSDGNEWKEYVVGAFGKLDHFITGNDYVTELLKETYDVVKPASLMPEHEWAPIRATMVRLAMAQGLDYRNMVPNEVADYLDSSGLVDRFRDEFGLETLVENTEHNWQEDAQTERSHILLA